MEGVLAAFAQFDNDLSVRPSPAGLKAALEIELLGVPGADRLLERAARDGQEPDARS